MSQTTGSSGTRVSREPPKRRGLHVVVALSTAAFLLIVALASPRMYRFTAEQPSATPASAHMPASTSPLTGRAATTSDWNQVGANPEHTSYSPETLGTNIKVAWTHPFQPERIFPQVQAIVYDDGTGSKVFVGTESGNLYALNAVTGVQDWVFTAGGPILNSVAADNGLVYFGAMDGAVYAVNTVDGTLAWKTQLSSRLGFSTAPVLAANQIFIGGRDGYFYSLDSTTGALVWKYDVGAPILMTAAYDQGKVFVGAMDMHVYALDSTTGALVWKSNKIDGMAFKEYWPVVTQGKVIVIGDGAYQTDNEGIAPGFPFTWFSSSSNYSWLSTYGPTIAAGNATQVPDFMNAQATAIANYQANPSQYHTVINVLDENSGQTAFVVPNFDTEAHNGAKPPPCVDSSGDLVVPVMFIQSGWGRLDLATQRFIDVLYDGTNYSGQPLQPNQPPAGFGNSDENLDVTCTANLILSMHIEEMSANYTGAFDLDTRKWIPIAKGWTNGQMFNNTQSGGANPATVSNGMIYHISVHELIARTTN